MESRKLRITIIGVLLALSVGFGGGVWFADWRQDTSPTLDTGVLVNREDSKPQEVDFGLFWQVWDVLNRKYVDTSQIHIQELIYGAIAGMVESVGDPYTVFFEPQLSKKFQEEIAGAFGGVGMEIGKRDNVLTIVTPIKDTPAFRAGLQPGDQILKVDERPTDAMSVEEAVNLIRGPKGTRVTITIFRTGETGSREVTLTRDTIRIPAVTWKLVDGGRIAYVDVASFNQNVEREFEKAAREILASDAERLILDLRNNPGGLLDASVTLAGWFLERNSVVTIEDFGNGQRNEFRTSGNAALKKYPMVILVNGGSASASEILAGALRDNRGVKLIGEKTFGKGSVQELEKFSDGSSLKVTIAKWLTPSGTSISEKGIEASIEIAIDPATIEKQGIVIGEEGKDPQLDKAIDAVNK